MIKWHFLYFCIIFASQNFPSLVSLKFKTLAQHDKLQINKCGLFVNPKHPTLEVSSDGIISCDCCEIITLEIKCPYNSRDFTPEIAIEYEKLTFLKHDKDRLKNHAYYYQV